MRLYNRNYLPHFPIFNNYNRNGIKNSIRRNKCGLEEFKSFINNLPKKKGWEEWKRKDGNKNGNF